MLDYRYETFMALTEDLNYTKAAKNLNLSQPAVTKHIQYLEDHLGVQLVTYKNRQLTITESGLYLKERIRDLEKESKRIKEALSNRQEVKSITIGASRTIGEYYIWNVIREFQKAENCEAELIVDNTTILLAKLDQQKIDVALISGPFDEKKYDTLNFLEHPVVCVCHPHHPLANKLINLADLKNERLLLRETGAGILDVWEDTLKKNNLTSQDFPHQTTIGNINVIKDLIIQGEGISMLYEMSVKKELARGLLKTITIQEGPVTVPFKLVFNKRVTQTKRIKHFTSLLLSHS